MTPATSSPGSTPPAPTLVVAGIPIFIRPTFWLIVAAFGAGRIPSDSQAILGPVVAWAAVVFASVLLHEMGHAVAFRWAGHHPRIELHAMGGTTMGTRDRSTPPGKGIIIALAGPLAGFALGGVAWGLQHILPAEMTGALGQQILRDLVWANIGWGIFNLLPVYPLDGGLVVANTLRLITGKSDARHAFLASIVLSSVLLVVALLAGAPIAAVLFVTFIIQNVALYRGARASARETERRTRIMDATRAFHAGRLDDAEAATRDVLDGSTDLELRVIALHLVARIRLEQGRAAEALKILETLPGRAIPDGLLMGAVLRAAGQPLRAESVLRSLFQRRPYPPVARELATSMLDSGHADDLRALLSTPEAETWSDDVCAAFAEVLFSRGLVEESLAINGFRHRRLPTGDSAYQAARACSRLGRIDDAVTWLRAAVAAGFHDTDRLQHDDALAPVRTTPAWSEFDPALHS